MDSGIGIGFGQAMEKLPGLALNLAQMQQQGQHIRALEADSASRLALDQKKFELDKTSSGIRDDLVQQQAKAAELATNQLKKDTELVPVDYMLDKLGYKTPAQKEWWKKKGAIHIENQGGVDYVQRKKGVDLYTTLEKDPEANLEIGRIQTDDLSKAISEIDTQMSNPESKLKPEQVQQLTAQKEALVMERTRIANAMKYAEREARSKYKESIKNFYDPASNTWVQKNTVTDDITGLIPETAQLRQMEIDKAERTRQQQESGLDKRALAANASRERAAGMRASSTPKESLSNDRLLGKEKLDVEAKLLEEPTGRAAAAYAARYNELSDKDEYVLKPAVKTGWFDGKSDTEAEWVKQPKGNSPANNKMSESKLLSDLMENGYTKQGAADYIKRAKAAGKI